MSLRLTVLMGTFMITMFAILLQNLLFLISWPLVKKLKVISRFHEMTRKKLHWNGIIRLFLESYLDLCLGIMHSWTEPHFDTPSDIFDFVLTLVSSVFVIGGPIFSYLLVRKNRNGLDKEEFQKKYGSLTGGFFTTGILGSEATGKMISWFMVRRFLTSVVIVYLAGLSPVFQIVAAICLSLADVIINYDLNAYENKINGLIAKINDFMVLILSYFPLLYAGLVHDPDVRYDIGWG